ncbi:MAG: Rrf2 family transcriptional regulator [Planctomycetes bacterium]|nr:Rrf2 family transcriptional regulator [Planctomycetota bacterium]
MLRLTKRAEYGLTALVHLVDHSGETVSARKISEHYSLPHRLVGEALKDLCRAGFLHSERGPAGGYQLARQPGSLTVGEAVAALEGAPEGTDCEAKALVGLGYGPLGDLNVESKCLIRSPLHKIQEDIWRQFERTTIQELASPEFTLLRNERGTLQPLQTSA